MMAERFAVERQNNVIWVHLSPLISDRVTAEHIIEMLGLKRHPTCGFVAETYRSQQQIPQQALPISYAGSRPFGSVLYFLVTPEAQIRLHRIRSDQMYHHYLGEPLEVLLLYPDGTGEITVIGSDLAAGMRPQLFIPGGTFHISRLRDGSNFALLGTTEWPGFELPDLELGDPDKLTMDYPVLSREIQDFIRQSGG